jgi:hypothetical protein
VREARIPDAHTFSLDLKFGGVSVAGIVVDRETGEGIRDAAVSAAPQAKGAGASGGFTGADGRFTLELEPGSYKIRAAARGYAPGMTDVTVAGAEIGDVRLELARGLTIQGKVVDRAGRLLSETFVTASTGGAPGATTTERTLPDGRCPTPSFGR